jgi:EpsI family protein
MDDHPRSYSQSCVYLFFLFPLLATAFLYSETLVRLGKGLFSYENSHGLVILAISLYLAWEKRYELARQSIKPNLIGGSIITGLGCAFLVVRQYGITSMLLMDFSLVVTLLGLALLLLGTSHLKILMLPIGYLLFAYPMFDYMPSNVVVHLQYVTAWLAANILKIIGISVYHNAIDLVLPHITLQVVQACAGLNHIVALLAVSVLLAHFALGGWLKKIVLVTAALFIGLAANGLRVAIIGVISTFSQPGPLHGPADIFYVSFVFIIGLAVIILLSYLMGGRSLSHHTKQKTEKDGGKPFHDTSEAYPTVATVRNRGSLYFVPLLIATIIPVFAYAYTDIFSPRPVPLANSLSNIPLQIGEWEATCGEKTDFIPADVRPDEKLVRCYQNEIGDEFQLYIAYFTHQRKSRKVTDFTLNSYNEGEEFPILSAGDKITLRKAVPNKAGPIDNVYFWYSIDGKVIPSRLEAKVTLFANGIIKNRTNGTLVVFKIGKRTDNSKDKDRVDRAVIKTIYPVIQDYINSLND